MSCEKVQEQISLMLDRRLTDEEWEHSQGHIQACRRCEAHLESTRSLRDGLRGMAAPAVPVDLASRLRVVASHEHARRRARANFAARLRGWRSDIRLSFDNLMRPFAVPVTGGLFTALLMFSILLPTLNSYQRSSAYEPPLAVLTDPDGEIVGTTREPLRLQPGSATITGNEVSLVLLIDECGRVQDYYLSGGELTDEMTSLILLSRFTPATIDGQPTWGLKQVVFPRRPHHGACGADRRVPQKFGQHFLRSGPILERIARAICPEPAELVIEIGPGKGALTEKLLDRAGRVVAIEIDPAMVDQLHAKFAGEARLEIVHADVLAIDLPHWGRVPITGNLPYYITSPILAKTLRAQAPRAVFLIQKEVAERLTAAPGTRDYGYLTVQTALFGEARRLFDVKPGAFRPPPKVDSTVILVEPRDRDLGIADRQAFLVFLGHCFRQKRKTLRNNLAEVYGREAISAWPEGGLRAEQIPLATFAELFRRLGETPPSAV